MKRPCLLRSGSVGLRWLRYQFSPWITLAIASCNLLCSSGVQRSQERLRYLSAISKIDFVRIYELLNDLLW